MTNKKKLYTYNIGEFFASPSIEAQKIQLF